MTRSPYQVLAIGYRPAAEGVWEYLALRRADVDYWQWVAGGGEAGEAPVDAARREISEETGADAALVIHLESQTTIPVAGFPARSAWNSGLYVIPEYAFAFRCEEEVALSEEHVVARWVGYEAAARLLRWDSNRTALWELRERLQGGDLGHAVVPSRDR